jgi:hypothetical protein
MKAMDAALRAAGYGVIEHGIQFLHPANYRLLVVR